MTKTINFDANGAKRVRADVAMNIGKMEIAGGARKVFEGEFTCSYDEWQPLVKYDVEAEVGKLSVMQPDIKNRRWFNNWVNRWEMQFNNDIPLDLRIELNAGTADLQLSDLKLHELDVELNSGNLRLALQGDQPQLTVADFEINAANVNMALNGWFPLLKLMDIEVNAGRLMLDLTGTWRHSLDIALESSAAWVTVKLPRQVNVEVTMESSLAVMRHSGLRKKGNLYLHESGADVTLRLDIEASVGKIDLQVVDKVEVVTM